MLLTLDLDGTLLDSQGRLPKNIGQELQKFSNEGWTIVVATARPNFGIQQFKNELESVSYFICCQGAHVLSQFKNTLQELYVSYLPVTISQGIWNRAVMEQLEIWWISDNQWYAYQKTSTLINEEKLLRSTCKIIAEPPKTAALKIMMLGDSALREKIIGDSLSFINVNLSNNGRIMEITSKGVEKGNSLKKYVLGNKKQFSIVIGDSDNDLDMFSVSNLSVAVSTANCEILGAADKIINRDPEKGIVDLFSKIKVMLL